MRTVSDNCVTVTLSRIGGIEARASRVSDFAVTVGLVCTVNISPIEGIIWASDGKLITLEGGYLIAAE